MFNNYDEVLENARKVMAPKCRVCKECNGIACAGEIPGVGGTKSGKSFIEAWAYLKGIGIQMDAVHEHFDADTSIELFGKSFKYPFFIAPIGGMSFNYTGALTEAEYTTAAVNGAVSEGIFAFTGDGPVDAIFDDSLPIIESVKYKENIDAALYSGNEVEVNIIFEAKQADYVGWSALGSYQVTTPVQ